MAGIARGLVGSAVLQLLLVVLYEQVNGDYTISLRISSYSNPSHEHHRGDCCDNVFWCLNDCDNYFVVCGPQGPPCLHTGEVGGDSLSFTSYFGNLHNPITFSVAGPWTGSVLVVIDVYDDDDFFPATLNGDEFVDQFNLTSPTSGRTSLQGRYGRGTITYSLSVSCSQNYYGPECSVYCVAVSGNHTCNSNGSWLCVEGWTGEYCATCEPRPQCSTLEGYCRQPRECLCRSGFTGYLCDTPTTEPTPTDTTMGTPTDMTTRTPTDMTPGTPTDMTTGTPTDMTTGTPTQTPTDTTTEAPTDMTTGTPTEPPTDMTTGTPTDMTTGTPTDIRVPTVATDDVVVDSSPGARSQRNGVGGVVGGVVAGVMLLLLLVLLVLGVLCFVSRQRQKRMHWSGVDDSSDTNSLVQPLVGENPVYMDRYMGTHVQQNNKNYHQFSNPLYTDRPAQPTPPRDIPTYSYPRVRSYLVPSVYLPGDDSPLSASLSGTPSHQPASHSPAIQPPPSHPPANQPPANHPPPSHPPASPPPSQQSGSETSSVQHEQQPLLSDSTGTTSHDMGRDSQNYARIELRYITDPQLLRQSAADMTTSEGGGGTSEPSPSLSTQFQLHTS